MVKNNIANVFRKSFKVFIPLFLGLAVLWLLLKRVDLESIIASLRHDVDYLIILISLPFGLLGNVFRALRWDLLIRPLGYKARKSNLIYAILGSYCVNLAIPRFGEIWRCTVINRYDKVPFTKLVGTVITDRIFDPVMVVLIIAVAFVLNVPFFKEFFIQHPDIYVGFGNIFTSVGFYACILIPVIVLWAVLKKYRRSKFVVRIIKSVADVLEGVRSLLGMERKWLFALYTVLIWASYFLYFYICFYAFSFTRVLGLNCGFIAFGMSSIAMAVPVQGGVGAWHVMVIAVLMGFGVSDVNATAFAFCVHTVQAIIFTVISGLFGIVALSVANRKR
jgi:uncharacterized protein (TIRG00374 family)